MEEDWEEVRGISPAPAAAGPDGEDLLEEWEEVIRSRSQSPSPHISSSSAATIAALESMLREAQMRAERAEATAHHLQTERNLLESQAELVSSHSQLVLQELTSRAHLAVVHSHDLEVRTHNLEAQLAAARAQVNTLEVTLRNTRAENARLMRAAIAAPPGGVVSPVRARLNELRVSRAVQRTAPAQVGSPKRKAWQKGNHRAATSCHRHV